VALDTKERKKKIVPAGTLTLKILRYIQSLFQHNTS
jgi:hypothetical protein